jgi:Family of unknown function (DUF6065)
MRQILVRKTNPDTAHIEELGAKRDWMDETPDRHAYMCFPISLTNRLGWGISFPEDIRFIWDGITDTTDTHIKVLEGEKYVYLGRGNATISFNTGLIFKTDENTTILSMPVPNQFIRGAQAYTTLISSSFYKPELPLAWRCTEPNVEVFIPAGTPVAAILPISLGTLENDYELAVSDDYPTYDYWEELRKYGDAAQEKNGVGDWSKMYRDAVDHTGNVVGQHETKSIRLKTITCPVTGATIEQQD